MVNYWKSKVLPTIKKVFSAGNAKKAAAAEAAKTFDESKEGIDKDFEDKKTELQPKVLEIYDASSVEIKTLVKKPTPSGLKKNAAGVNKLLEELVKIEFPGSKSASELCTKFSPALASGPVTYIFEKVAIFLPAEEPAKVEEAAVAVEATSKDIAVEDIKKEEAAEKVEETPALAAAETPAPAEPKAEPAAETAEKPAEPEATPEPAAAAEPEKPAEPAAEEPAKAVEPAAEPAKAAEAAEEPAKA